jgi:L-ascorbate metabolism protein UlaG (beta-lactamase superfamily)
MEVYKMKIQFEGHSCFTVTYENHTVIIDPFLTGNPQAVKKAEEVKVDAVLLTHGHGDHIGDAIDIAKRNNAPIIAPYEVAMYASKKGAPIHPMHLGGSHTFPWGKVKLTLAFHGSGIEDGDTMIDGGNPCGFLLTMGDKTFYHAGDTALFGDMKLIGEMNRIDVAALPIGDNFTMGPEDAVYAAEWVRARTVIPMHYNTFPVIQQDPQKYVDALAKKEIKGVILQPGESIEI